jgi:hypothetical protein
VSRLRGDCQLREGFSPGLVCSNPRSLRSGSCDLGCLRSAEQKGRIEGWRSPNAEHRNIIFPLQISFLLPIHFSLHLFISFNVDLYPDGLNPFARKEMTPVSLTQQSNDTLLTYSLAPFRLTLYTASYGRAPQSHRMRESLRLSSRYAMNSCLCWPFAHDSS